MNEMFGGSDGQMQQGEIHSLASGIGVAGNVRAGFFPFLSGL